MNQYDFDSDIDDADTIYLDDYPDEPTRFWTKRRIALTIFAVIIILALLAYSFNGLFLPPPPTQVPLPRPSV